MMRTVQIVLQSFLDEFVVVSLDEGQDGNNKNNNDGDLPPSSFCSSILSKVIETIVSSQGLDDRRDIDPPMKKRKTLFENNNGWTDEETEIRSKRHCRRIIAKSDFYLVCNGKILNHDATLDSIVVPDSCRRDDPNNNVTTFISMQLKQRIRGGMDRQNRVGSKFGGGGVSSSQQAERERKERLKKLALESIDLAKDPYLVRNHLGSYECKLCLTLHRDEANYLAHTQGKKHQQGLAHRAYLEKLKQERDGGGTAGTLPLVSTSKHVSVTSRKIRIGRPAYQVFKSRDSETHQRCLSFELQYPEIEENLQPRHRFMSAFEQRVDSPPDRRYQYLLFAAEPYETVAFKIPNEPIDKSEGKFVTYWDTEGKRFTLTLHFMEDSKLSAVSGSKTS